MSEVILLDVPAVDWFTITTRNPVFLSPLMSSLNESDIENSRQSRFLQYEGETYPSGLFVGQGEVGGGDHYCVYAGGATADKYRYVTHYPVRTTRIDSQITLECPEIDIVHLFQAIRDSIPNKLGVIYSGDGLGTITVGSRQSDRYGRIYMKELGDGSLAIRFESEFKGIVASSWVKMSEDHGFEYACSSAIRWLLGRVSLSNDCECDTCKVWNSRYKQVRNITEKYSGDSKVKADPRLVSSPNTTLDWLMGTCLPSFDRLCRENKELSERLHEFGKSVQKTLDKHLPFPV